MAFIGLRKPIVAPRTGLGIYETPFAFGKAIGITVNPSYAEGSLNADDVQIEYDKEFVSAEVSLNTNTIPKESRSSVFGHRVEEDGEILFNADDENGYVGMGWVSVEKEDGKKMFTGNFLHKVKFSEPNEDYATKGENIEYKTPSITGRAVAEDTGDWKSTKTFERVVDALNYIYEKMGYKLEKLDVKSEAGTTSGKTKITVTPEKTVENTYVYRIGADPQLPYFDAVCTSGYTTWDGTEEITAKTGDKILIVEITKDKKARKAGVASVTVTGV